MDTEMEKKGIKVGKGLRGKKKKGVKERKKSTSQHP